MRLCLITFLAVLLTTTVNGQRKSIAIINDVESQLYYVDLLPLSTDPVKYECKYDQSRFAEEEMMRLLGEKHDVELIYLPAEYRKQPGILKSSMKKWLKSQSDRYDIVIYLYNQTKGNRRLFGPSSYPMYSSGLVVEGGVFSKEKTFIYSTVTARAYSTEKGVLMYNLDMYAENAIRDNLEKIAYYKDINDPALCLIISNGIQYLISHRYKEFVDKFEHVGPGWDYTL